MQNPQAYRRGPSRQRAVASVVEQGRTQEQLAREWGVARATVKRWVQG
ncbi:MAG: RNA polymerase subunit sigma-24, partial [Cyanobacteria bacterium QS_5_48_63]